MNEQEKLQEAVELVVNALKLKLANIGDYIQNSQGGDSFAINEAEQTQDLISHLNAEFGDLLGIKQPKFIDDF